jgi:hypothetical protein
MLPEWPSGTVTILSTGGGPPHAIPVSTAIRADPHTILLALGEGRESLSRLKADPAVALSIVTGADIAITAYGNARVVEGRLPGGVVAVRIDVDRVQGHAAPTFAIEGGVRWGWTDVSAEQRDAAVRAALLEIARER